MTPRSPTQLCLMTVILTIAVPLREKALDASNHQPTAPEQISVLRQRLENLSRDPRSLSVRDHLVALLAASNRYEEALQEYRQKVRLRMPSGAPDLSLLELLLKTGRYAEVLQLTEKVASNERSLLMDERLLEARIQAFLAQGQYREAREAADQWLGMYGKQGEDNTRYALEVKNIQHIRILLANLERTQSPQGKPLFTASVPDSFQRWSRQRHMPIVFFKLIPADPTLQQDGAILDEHRSEVVFKGLVADMNEGFVYLSGGAFSLRFKELHTLYVKADDLDIPGSHGSMLTDRIYVHTIPPLYQLAGKAFVVLVDYRAGADEEAAYMGDGLIHIAANKLHTLTLMHEVLHGLGATHQDWTALTRAGYRFDPLDRGLMTFSKGQLLDFGLEEKNRILLDWPGVTPIRMSNETADLSSLKALVVLLKHG